MAIEIQGHRGARGNIPENTFSSFEFALDAMVDSIETDLHLTADHLLILCHDSQLPGYFIPIHSIRGACLQKIVDAGNCNLELFPDQSRSKGNLTRLFCQKRGIQPWKLPEMGEMLEFLNAYMGVEGEQAGKSFQARENARTLHLDLEIKQLPFRKCDSKSLLGEISRLAQQHDWTERISIRSFDHQIAGQAREAFPGIPIGLLFDGTVVQDMTFCMKNARANYICPRWDTVDRNLVEEMHKNGFKVIPWTANQALEWEYLISLGVDGITTDYPKQLRQWLS